MNLVTKDSQKGYLDIDNIETYNLDSHELIHKFEIIYNW